MDGAATASDSWREASYSYRVSTGINIGSTEAPLIERRIVAIGSVGEVQKRVLATAHAELGSNGNLLQVFEQVGYKQCVTDPAASADPSQDC